MNIHIHKLIYYKLKNINLKSWYVNVTINLIKNIILIK